MYHIDNRRIVCQCHGNYDHMGYRSVPVGFLRIGAFFGLHSASVQVNPAKGDVSMSFQRRTLEMDWRAAEPGFNWPNLNCKAPDSICSLTVSRSSKYANGNPLRL